MEHARGVSLNDAWQTMTEKQKLWCIKAIYEKLAQIATVEFPAYGSLYHASACLDGFSCVAIDEGFCVGPHSSPIYWDRDPYQTKFFSTSKPNRGPCTF